MTLWSESSRKYAAKLPEIAPAADPATRTYLSKFSLPEADDEVSLGMTATLNYGTERVAVVGIAVQGLGMQHELPAFGRGGRRGNRDFAAKLVRCPGPLPLPMHSTSGACNE